MSPETEPSARCDRQTKPSAEEAWEKAWEKAGYFDAAADAAIAARDGYDVALDAYDVALDAYDVALPAYARIHIDAYMRGRARWKAEHPEAREVTPPPAP
jgi:hypothetical protein